MQQQLEQLETELTRLQIELRQVRQMIGSLIRTQEDTWRLMSQQQPYGVTNQQMQQNQSMGWNPTAINQLRQISDSMNQHLHQFAHELHPGSADLGVNLSNNPMALRHNDPMQNQY